MAYVDFLLIGDCDVLLSISELSKFYADIGYISIIRKPQLNNLNGLAGFF
jgi:hypothetical protein